MFALVAGQATGFPENQTGSLKRFVSDFQENGVAIPGNQPNPDTDRGSIDTNRILNSTISFLSKYKIFRNFRAIYKNKTLLQMQTHFATNKNRLKKKWNQRIILQYKPPISQSSRQVLLLLLLNYFRGLRRKSSEPIFNNRFCRQFRSELIFLIKF